MKDSCLKQFNTRLRSLAPLVITLVVCTGFFVAALVAFVKGYSVPTKVSPQTSFLEILHTEYANLSSIISLLIPAIPYYLIAKINPEYPKIFRFIWPFIFAVLIIYYRLAIDMELHRVLMAIVGYIFYLITVYLALVFDKIHKDSLSQDSSIARKALTKAIGNEIKNQSILNVQLFECEKRIKAGNISFRLINKAHLANTKSDDVNSILVLNLEMPEEDYNQFGITLNAFDKVVENGSEEEKKLLKSAISQKKGALALKLSAKNPENIDKKDSCMARLLTCYIMLEEMVDQPVQAVLELNDGELGLEIELEKALFSTLRTGMLGAILFQSQRRYYFRYRKDGYKAGRKYCAFLLDPERIKEEVGMDIGNMLVCLVTIRENSTNRISTDIIEWISRAENRIVKEYCRLLKGTEQ